MKRYLLFMILLVVCCFSLFSQDDVIYSHFGWLDDDNSYQLIVQYRYNEKEEKSCAILIWESAGDNIIETRSTWYNDENTALKETLTFQTWYDRGESVVAIIDGLIEEGVCNNLYEATDVVKAGTKDAIVHTVVFRNFISELLKK